MLLASAAPPRPPPAIAISYSLDTLLQGSDFTKKLKPPNELNTVKRRIEKICHAHGTYLPRMYDTSTNPEYEK
jgi:hypothetical protein